ncbi:cysteine--tRNA ligase [Candidatus Gracilibacteria bacterium]|nr:cysteine--tRNA ligase [Candidatus Gracilibacteria bacterium]
MQIYNTLTRQTEAFKPIRFPEVKMYQCGPTVYNNAHIGNLKTSIIEDTIARTLNFLGYKVKITMNITDVDDKTIRDSQAAGKSLSDFTQGFTEIFLSDLEKLGIELPENIKPVTELVPEMVRMIQTMLNRGFAYLADDGSVYYSISKFKKYGNLANLDMSGMKESVRIDNDEYEKDVAADFVLWKAWKKSDGENFWEESFEIPTFGENAVKIKNQAQNILDKKTVVLKGRPGWHIECSACAMKYFGAQIDIHMGGEDLIFPHHQNEIAQSEACTGKEFSKYWLHSGHLMVDGKKMSKSLGNFYTLRDLEEKYPNESRLYRAFRLSCINGLYRDQISFSFDKLEQNIQTIKNIDNTSKNLARFEAEYSGVRPEFRDYMQDIMVDFIESLENDFSFPEALATLFELTKYINSELADKKLTSDEVNSCVDMLLSFNSVFGIVDESIFEGGEDIPEAILHLAIARDEAKIEKNFELSDKLRAEIIAAGYSVVDTKQGTVVEKS